MTLFKCEYFDDINCRNDIKVICLIHLTGPALYLYMCILCVDLFHFQYAVFCDSSL